MKLPDDRVFMHSWCGTVVLIRPTRETPAGKPTGIRCPNGNCEQPDYPWWNQDLSDSQRERWDQLVMSFEQKSERGATT